MFVSLLGDRRAHHLVGRALFRRAQAAVADGLLDRPEAGEVADLQCPGQRGEPRVTIWLALNAESDS